MSRFAFGVADDAGSGFEDAPGSVLVAHTIFERKTDAGAASLLGCGFYAGKIVGMDLLGGGRILQLGERISQDFFIGKTVEDAVAVHIHDGNHVRGIFGD